MTTKIIKGDLAAAYSTTEGFKFDSDKVPLQLISPIALNELGKVMQIGMQKYGASNWRTGMHWTRVVGSLLRHVNAFNLGETHDQESGLNHMAHAMACCMMLVEYEHTHPELDDRYFAKETTE